MIEYPAKIQKKDGGYLVSFIDFENINTYGKTLEEALVNAEEALNGCLESDFERNYRIPNPSKIKGKQIYSIPVASNITIALLLRQLRAHMSQLEVAKKLGVSYQVYQRLENPHKSNPTIKTLEKIAKVYGKHINVGFTS